MTTTAPDTDSVSIRLARRADLIAVNRIERASFEQPWPFGAFERFLDEPSFLVADASAGVVGYVIADTVSDRGRELGHVKDLAVHPDVRGHGIGSRLLERALSSLTARGARQVKLEVRESNRAARHLYDRFGFERHHVVPGYYDDGEDAIVLALDVRDRE